AGESGAAPLHGGLGLAPLTDEVDDPLARLQRGELAARGSGCPRRLSHPRTPTRTPRKRAGAAGCPVWADCMGWPLPQLRTPQGIQLAPPASMSSEPQNWGVMPV